MDALEAFRNFAFCGNKVALYGFSRGAEHALLVASLMPQEGLPHLPDAVAAHSPADVVCGGFDSACFREAKDNDWKAW